MFCLNPLIFNYFSDAGSFDLLTFSAHFLALGKLRRTGNVLTKLIEAVFQAIKLYFLKYYFLLALPKVKLRSSTERTKTKP